MIKLNPCLMTLTILWVLGWHTVPPLAGQALSESEETEAREAITELLVRFRTAAAEADAEAYFGCLASDGVFFGTDGRERWDREQLRELLEPYFSQGTGWTHEVRQRHVYLGPGGQVGWFEEQSFRENLGEFRTTGVVRRRDDDWEIVQYHVDLVIPNETIEQVVEIIRQWQDQQSSEPDATIDQLPRSE